MRGMTSGDGDAVLERRRSRRDVRPWLNAAQRAAARAAAEESAGAAGRPSVEAPVVPRTARPRIEDDPGLLGITRRSHSRLGSRLFTLFFVFVFLLILVQLVVVLLDG